MSEHDAFLAELDAFAEVARSLDDAQLMAASRCAGWSVVDVVVHVHLGLQEMLLGLVSPTSRPPDTDAASYWRSPPPTNDRDADRLDGTRFVRLLGAAYRRPTNAVNHLLPTVAGIRQATRALAPGAVAFQGHVLSTADFLTTWAVELAIHHLDLGRELELPPPDPKALAQARWTVESLAGGPLPPDWPDDEVVLLGAGRIEPDAAHREASAAVSAFPVLG